MSQEQTNCELRLASMAARDAIRELFSLDQALMSKLVNMAAMLELHCSAFVFLLSIMKTTKANIRIKTLHLATKAVQTRRLTMGVADGRVEADGETIYQVKDMKVALSES